MLKLKKLESSKIILGSIILFFSIVLYLSISVLLDYNSLQNKIEKKFYSEFKINLKILDKISLKIFPKPFFLVKEANLDLNIEDDSSSIVKTKDLRIYIPFSSLYSKSNIKINSLEINNTNIYFKLNDIKDLRKHLYYKINKPIYIKKSKLFLLDNNNNTILISPINKIEYLINEKNNFKGIEIKGNIFDVNYESFWKRYYDDPKKTFNEIKFKNPNLYVKNLFTIKDNKIFEGTSSIDFLNENITFTYLINNDKIFIDSPKKNIRQKIKLKSTVELNPFDFDAKLFFDNKSIDFFIENIFYFLLNLNDEDFGNLNGNLSLILTNVDNLLIDRGEINLSIKEKSIKLKKSLFNIRDIGSLKSNIMYYESQGDLIFATKNILEIVDKKEFSKKFQVSSKKIKNINKIFFDIEKNIDNGEISISNIYFNEIDKSKFSEKFYIINNFQKLKSVLKKILS